MRFFWFSLLKHILWYSFELHRQVDAFELHRQVDAIQMGTHNICLYKEVDNKYSGCNLKTAELLDCVHIGVCVVIRWNTVFYTIFGCDIIEDLSQEIIAWDKALFFNHKLLIFSYFHENICCGYSLEVPIWAASYECPQHMVSVARIVFCAQVCDGLLI